MKIIKTKKELRRTTSVRVQPSMLEKIRRVYGTLGNFIFVKAMADKKIRELKEKKN